MQLHRQRFVSLQHEVNASTVSLVERAVQRGSKREAGREWERHRGVKGVRSWSGGEGRGRVNEHSLFDDARCGCRLSQPYHPCIRARGERLGEQRDRWVGWRGGLYPVPEQCLIGNRATNNYPYARIRTTDARCHWLKLARRGADCQWYTGGDKNRCSAANNDAIKKNS